MKSELKVGNVRAGSLAGRGQLRGTVDVRDGEAFIRIDDDADPSVWVEVTLNLDVLLQADVNRPDDDAPDAEVIDGVEF